MDGERSGYVGSFVDFEYKFVCGFMVALLDWCVPFMLLETSSATTQIITGIVSSSWQWCTYARRDAEIMRLCFLFYPFFSQLLRNGGGGMMLQPRGVEKKWQSSRLGHCWGVRGRLWLRAGAPLNSMNADWWILVWQSPQPGVSSKEQQQASFDELWRRKLLSEEE